MAKSKTTDYIIQYLKKNQIPVKWVVEKLGIAEEKLDIGYTEPLLADEFLELCAFLHLRPEDIAEEIALLDENKGKSV